MSRLKTGGLFGGGLRGTLVAATMTATAAIVLTSLLLEDPIIEYRVRRQIQDDLLEAAGRAARRISVGEEVDPVADEVGARSAAHITVILPDGRIVGDTAFDGAALIASEAHVEHALIAEARERGEAHRIVLSDDAPRRMSAAVALEDGRVVQATRSMEQVDTFRESVRELLLVAGFTALLAGLLLTWALSRAMVVPVRELMDAADGLAKGDLSTRIRSERSDELGELARAVDRMADQLEERLESLRAEEARLRTVLDSMVEAVLVTDATGRVALGNRALEELAGPAFEGRTPMEVIRSAELDEAIGSALAGEAVVVELELSTGVEGKDLAAQVAPLPDGAGVVTVLHDVTERRRIDRVRSDFVANASHELRTPLTAIRGFAETLVDGALERPETARRFLDVILRHTLRLQALVDDMVALSKAESPDQELNLRSIDVWAVAEEVVRGLESQAGANDLSIKLEPDAGPLMAIGSRRAVDQILINLVDNAIKYTPAGGKVCVRILPGDARLSVEVEDSGAGIPAEHHERIFERFYRVDKGRARDVGGTGLGLAIVKHLSVRMGADIEVESRPGQGTLFRLTLNA